MSKKKQTRRRFTPEFKAETVKLVKQSNRTMADVAMELGISPKSVGEWVRLAEESGDVVAQFLLSSGLRRHDGRRRRPADIHRGCLIEPAVSATWTTRCASPGRRSSAPCSR